MGRRMARAGKIEDLVEWIVLKGMTWSEMEGFGTRKVRGAKCMGVVGKVEIVRLRQKSMGIRNVVCGGTKRKGCF